MESTEMAQESVVEMESTAKAMSGLHEPRSGCRGSIAIPLQSAVVRTTDTQGHTSIRRPKTSARVWVTGPVCQGRILNTRNNGVSFFVCMTGTTRLLCSCRRYPFRDYEVAMG